ncbi:hypothetical protein ES708_31690 [subsurface metagenome]
MQRLERDLNFGIKLLIRLSPSLVNKTRLSGAKSGQTEHPIPEQNEHMIPEMAEHLKPERKHHNINAKRLYNLITNRLLTLNWNRVLTNTGICRKEVSVFKRISV